MKCLFTTAREGFEKGNMMIHFSIVLVRPFKNDDISFRKSLKSSNYVTRSDTLLFTQIIIEMYDSIAELCHQLEFPPSLEAIYHV